jgi:hypothetical protein
MENITKKQRQELLNNEYNAKILSDKQTLKQFEDNLSHYNCGFITVKQYIKVQYDILNEVKKEIL